MKEWIGVAATIAGWLFVILIAVDRWVHKQGSASAAFEYRIRTLEERVRDLKTTVQAGNVRSSEASGRINQKVASLERDVTRLLAIEESSHWGSTTRRLDGDQT